MNAQHDRAYIRHPSSIPIEVEPFCVHQQLCLQLQDMSVGGLSFQSPVNFHRGAMVKIRILGTKPVFRVNGVVQWCKSVNDHYELGVEFLREDDAFRVRMMEQVCHIEHYRKRQLKRGRRLSKNKASLEWIAKHGARFPH